MNELIYAKINGVEYPLRCGMMAMTEVSRTYEGLKGLFEALTDEDTSVSRKALCFLTYHLIKNGEAVEKYELENNVVRPDIKSPEHIEAIIGYLESAALFKAVERVINNEATASVQSEKTENDAKKVIATQEQ